MKKKQALNKVVLFTEGYIATEVEVNKAKEVGAKIVCGLHGDDYTREVDEAYGRVPEHLRTKMPVRKVSRKKSPEIINATKAPPKKKATRKKVVK